MSIITQSGPLKSWWLVGWMLRFFEMTQQYTGKSNTNNSIQPTMYRLIPHSHAHADRTFHSGDGYQRKKSLCVFFKRGYKLNKSIVVINPKERQAIVKQNGLCFNTLVQHKAAWNSLVEDVGNNKISVSTFPPNTYHLKMHCHNQTPTNLVLTMMAPTYVTVDYLRILASACKDCNC